MVGGILINFGIVLCVQSLKIGLYLSGFLSIAGLTLFLIPLFKNHLRFRISDKHTIFQLLGIVIIYFLLLSPIITEPLSAWDARSIWFFHAKMIFLARSIGLSAGWQNTTVLFSHADYPIMVPTLAAQIAYLFGFWNEYLPKLSLLFVFFPAFIWLSTFLKRSFSFVFLILVLPFYFFPWIWNGYMDGLLAFYFAISMLLIGRFLLNRQFYDLACSIVCLIFIINIKNEGTLAFLAGMTILLFVAFFNRNRMNTNKRFSWKFIPITLFSILPYIIWQIYKNQWALSNDLQIGSQTSISRLLTRLADGSFQLILTSIFGQLKPLLMMLGLIFIVMIIWKVPYNSTSIPAFIAALIYCAGIFIIYLITPADLNWHLITSVNRTMLSVNSCLIVGSYWLLYSIEKRFSNTMEIAVSCISLSKKRS